MSYTGVVKNGVVVLPKEAQLADGMEVRVELVSERLPTLAEELEGCIGAFKDLPSDYALNWRHYKYGEAKRGP